MRGTLKPLIVALGLSLASQMALAAGFGKINVISALGQPLSAEIDLLNVSADDLAGMQVRLAPQDSFKEANVEYSPALSGVKFAIEHRPGGQPYIRVTSSAPMSEPALNLLVEVTWPSGRLLRDYPILLSPAGYSAPAQQLADGGPRTTPMPPEVPLQAGPLTTAPAPAVAERAPVPVAPAAPARASPRPVVAAKPAPSPAAARAPGSEASGRDYVVRPGDTLRGLAAENRPASASLEQTMLAMFEANRNAFIDDSIHRIRAGKHVHLPDTAEANAVSADEASRRINLLASDFDAYRKRLADSTAAKPAAPATDKGPVTGKLSASTEDAARPAKPGGSDVLQVSRSAAARKADGLAQRKTGADERATQLEEEAVARENQLREARERVALLEGNLTQMKKLLGDKANPAVPAPDKTAPAGDKTAAAAPVAGKSADTPTPAPVLTPPVATPEAIKPTAPPVEAPKPQAARPPTRVPPPDESFLDDVVAQLSANPLALGGGLLAGLLVGWIGLNSLRRRRDRTQELFAPTTSSPEPMTVDSVTAEKASAMIDTQQGAFPSEFDRVVPEHQVDEVDPVAEADVYIAYGRDVQAEEILKEAMVKDPDRTEILMKLLEIYAQRRNAEEYAQHALQLRDRVGVMHPLWSAAMAMGYEIDPGNPLYQGAGEDFTPPPPSQLQPHPVDLDLSDHGLQPHAHASAAERQPTPAPDLDLHAPDPHALARGEALGLEPLGEALDIGHPESGATQAEHPVHEQHEQPAPLHTAELDPDATLAHALVEGAHPHLPESDDEAAETLRALSAISAESLRGADPGRADALRPDPAHGEVHNSGWPTLPEIAAVGATGGLSVAAHGDHPTKPGETDPFTLDFELGDANSPGSKAGAINHGNAAVDLGKIDLDLAPEPTPSSPPVLTLVSSTPPQALAAVPGEPAETARSFGDIDLDLKPVAVADSPAAASPFEHSSQWHNVATKLDLARAYLEIGDKEGAREILREVSVEGDEAQRQEAERLVVQI